MAPMEDEPSLFLQLVKGAHEVDVGVSIVELRDTAAIPMIDGIIAA